MSARRKTTRNWPFNFFTKNTLTANGPRKLRIGFEEASCAFENSAYVTGGSSCRQPVSSSPPRRQRLRPLSHRNHLHRREISRLRLRRVSLRPPRSPAAFLLRHVSLRRLPQSLRRAVHQRRTRFAK